VKIEFDPLFEECLLTILSFIEEDSAMRADAFEQILFDRLEDLVFFPLKFRQSNYYDDPNIRDFIFKGYTIPYLVDEAEGRIVVLDIFKWSER